MSKTKFGIGRIWRVLRLCLAIVLALAAPAEALVRSHESGLLLEFDIPEGPLAQSLKVFSDRAGVMIVFDNDLVEGLSAPRLSGRLTAPQALTRLLDETPLSYHKINHDTWAIIPAGEATPEINVSDRPTPPESTPARAQLRDEIIVTASYRAPVQQAGMRALYTLDGEQFRLQGAINVAEPIFDLPATVSSITSANTALLLSSAGLNLADLRGLGPERTLVLVNGRRFVRTSGGNGTIIGVDLNSIPAPFVERIEIVNQGAGATIGAEAVAGAINIVTREEIDGIALTVDGGVSEEGDAEEYAFSIFAGKSFWGERAKISAGVTYAQDPSLLAQERVGLTMPYGFSLNGRSSFAPDAVFTPGFGGSSYTPNGRLSGIVTRDGNVAFRGVNFDSLVFSPDGTSFEPFVGRLDQLYDFTTDVLTLPKIERLIGYASGSVEISGKHKFYGEAHFANSDVDTQIASLPVAVFRGLNPLYGDGIFVPADNPFIPAGLLAQAESMTGQPVDGLLLERRFVELGPRKRDITRESFQLLAGVDGPLSGDWRYDVSYQHGRAQTRDKASGIASGDRLAIALNVSQCATTVGCSPINIFGSENITPDQADFIRATPRQRILTIREQVAQAKISGPVFENRGERAFLTAGIDYRREALNDEPVVYNGEDGALGEFIIPGAGGSVSFMELFANATAPVIVDAPFARVIEIGGALRYIARGDGPDFLSISGNGRWSPIEGVNLYTHIFHGGRAPNVVELLGAGPDIGVFYFDPCTFTGGDATLEKNCSAPGALGVPAGFVQTRNLTTLRTTGNPDLREERINSQVYGASVDFHSLFPDIPGSLTLSADWREHEVEDFVSYFSASELAFQCYSSENLSDFLCGESPATGNLFIIRDPVTRQITSLEETLANDGYFRSSGLDARMQYFAEIDGGPLIDFFSLDVLYTYNHQVRTLSPFDDGEQRLEGLAAFPRHQIHLTASLGAENLKTVWTVRRRGRALSTRESIRPEVRIPAVVYVDASLQIRPTDNAIIFMGVENLFDVKPPIVAFAGGNTFKEFYDIIGRRFFAGVKTEF